jgi:hypothetical protein
LLALPRLLFIHIGLNLQVVDHWNMGCVMLVSFAVLINKATFTFFKPTWGLRQGCPLSPYLFLLVADGLSRAIDATRREGDLVGIRVGGLEYITHLLFMDNVLLFGQGSVREAQRIKKL